MTDQQAQKQRQRRVLIGLALLFFSPLGLAFYLYYGPVAWRPASHVNAGELVEPARPLPSLALPLLGSGSTQPNFLKGKWTFLYVESGSCAEACRKRLYDTRQVRLALDREMPRVQRVLIAGNDCCDIQFLKQHPDLIVIHGSAAAAPLLTLLPGYAEAAADAINSSSPSRVYLIDPLGNLMMLYTADIKSKGMLEDMKRLLRLSSIG